jgi:hypothetical protein
MQTVLVITVNVLIVKTSLVQMKKEDVTATTIVSVTTKETARAEKDVQIH